MTDPSGAFGNRGVVSLKEFKKDIENEGGDYIELVRRSYGDSLMNIYYIC